MSRALRFTLGILAGLGLLVLASSYFVSRTLNEWFERDLAGRADLSLAGAHDKLTGDWSGTSSTRMRALLTALAHDERLVAAAACSREGTLIAASVEWPPEVSCSMAARHVRPAPDVPISEWKPWRSVVEIAGGPVHLSALPVIENDQALGLVLLMHDFGFAERREAQIQRLLVGTFAVLACAASLLTVVIRRASWRGWTNEIRRVLREGLHKPEFQPLMSDVRDLLDRITAERDLEGSGGVWTPERLKDSLRHFLLGERVVVLANREPYIHEFTPEGDIEIRHPASGLVTALEPVMRACSGVWIAHGSGSADRATVDAKDHIKVPPGDEAYVLRRVWLNPQEEQGYYYGFSNEGIWPLCHIAHTRPVFRTSDWEQYRNVNERFAKAVVEEVDAEDPIVLVQDYHFALAPQLIRQRLPKATILTFWHIPWPNFEQLAICPWTGDLLEGLLGSSILGFQTQFHCNHFFDAVDRYLEARIDREFHAVVHGGSRTLVRPYPISIDWPNPWSTSAPSAAQCRQEIFAELGLPPDALVGVGVDRLDYTKGIEERLLAVERLLLRYPEYRGRFTFVQLAAPSRSSIPEYRAIQERVDSVVVRVNQAFGTPTYRPIILRRSHHEPPRVFRFLKAAHLVYVSSLHDGMNLVAKEFVAARDDELGVLVLSSFTGASRELPEALIVNPYDLDEASDALRAALEMPLSEQRMRMRAMRRFVAEFNVYRWAARMLRDAERLRRRERMAGGFGNGDDAGIEAGA
jgi:trehalose 6-phosphate synthase